MSAVLRPQPDCHEQVMRDVQGLVRWARLHGLFDRVRGAAPLSRHDRRVLSTMEALAEIVFIEAGASDAEAFDLYDHMRRELPNHKPNVPAFERRHAQWRAVQPFEGRRCAVVCDLQAYRRVVEYVRAV